MFMLHVLAPLLPSPHRSLSAKMYGLDSRRPGKDARRRRKKSPNEIDRWIETKNVYLVHIFDFFAYSDIIQKPQQKPARPQSHRILHYNLFEMPIRYGIEFAVNRQPEKKTKKPASSPKKGEIMWMSEYNLNAICEFKRPSNMSLTTNERHKHTRHCWPRSTNGVEAGGESEINRPLFLSDTTDPAEILNLPLSRCFLMLQNTDRAWNSLTVPCELGCLLKLSKFWRKEISGDQFIFKFQRSFQKLLREFW